MILIISSTEDEHAVSVMKKLDEKNVPYFLFDTSSFPKDIQLAVEYSSEKNSIVLNSCSEKTTVDCRLFNVAWWRRPQPVKLDPEIKDPSAIEFAYNESTMAITGLWQMLDAFWINHPLADEAASKKIFQLKVASETGMKIPRTCITNDPSVAKKFANDLKESKIIYKTFLATERAWRETRLLKEENFEQMESVKFAPVIFQEFIPAVADLRVTVIGNMIFCIAVNNCDLSYEYDYRIGVEKVQASAFDLPSNMKQLILKFMKRLNLVYGAIDLRLTPEGEYYFLEINTSGQWQFLEEKTSLKITDYFVDFLISQTRYQSSQRNITLKTRSSAVI